MKTAKKNRSGYVRPTRVNMRKVEDFIISNRELLERMSLDQVFIAICENFKGEFVLSIANVRSAVKAMGLRVRRKTRVVRKARKVAPAIAASVTKEAVEDDIERMSGKELVTGILEALVNRTSILRESVVNLYKELGIFDHLPEGLKK